MPRIDLSDTELLDAALVIRAAAWEAQKIASLQLTPSLRLTFKDKQRRYERLARKFEALQASLQHGTYGN